MDWLKDLELVRLLRTVLVSVDETWEINDIRFDAVIFLVLLCMFSILSYCLDIYRLVRRRTMTETMIGMLLPGMAALAGAVWLTEYGSLPFGETLVRLAEHPFPFSMGLSVQLTACAVLYAAVFAVLRLKPLSCIVDILTALMAFAAGCYGMFTNAFLRDGRNLFAGSIVLYGIFMYLLPLLLFKTALLFIMLLFRVYSARITAFPYRQGMDAGRYLYGWQLLYRCPLLREVIAFSLVTGTLLAKAAPEVSREDALLGTAAFLCLAVGYLWAAVRRSVAPLRKFRRWGKNQVQQERYLKEQFCREYFCEEPLFRDGEYTLTRNFLVESKNSAGIFYLGSLRYLPRGWRLDGKKWIRVLTFEDGSSVSLEKGKGGSGEILRSIEKYAQSYGIAESGAMADKNLNTNKAYMAAIRGQLLVVCTVVVMLILTVVLLDGLGVWG